MDETSPIPEGRLSSTTRPAHRKTHWRWRTWRQPVVVPGIAPRLMSWRAWRARGPARHQLAFCSRIARSLTSCPYLIRWSRLRDSYFSTVFLRVDPVSFDAANTAPAPTTANTTTPIIRSPSQYIPPSAAPMPWAAPINRRTTPTTTTATPAHAPNNPKATYTPMFRADILSASILAARKYAAYSLTSPNRLRASRRAWEGEASASCPRASARSPSVVAARPVFASEEL